MDEIRPEPNFNGVEFLTVNSHLLREVRFGVNKWLRSERFLISPWIKLSPHSSLEAISASSSE
jgi:hypothetical protein